MALVVNKIRKQLSRGGVRAEITRLIDALPQQLEELYTELLKTADDLQEAKGMFEWIYFAEQPLSITDLRYALAVYPDSCFGNIREIEECDHWVPGASLNVLSVLLFLLPCRSYEFHKPILTATC